MFPTARLAITAALSTAGLAGTYGAARAQVGPGACDCAVAPAPVVVVAPAPQLPKWGIGLRMTSLTLAPESNPDAETQYGGGGLQLRYRLAPRWQLELALDHVQEQLEDGTMGTRQLDSATLAAQYHFRPYNRWDWYAMVGIGGTSNGDPEISDEEREASSVGHVALGVGLERRWNHLAIGAELRAVGIAPREEAKDVPQTDPVRPTGMTVPGVAENEGASGGQLTIAATYYF
ncbi:MAG TPA: outer membrane beta-barrel protein [Kofleriaceae bacterium]|nr:outer membrane beta-barrel protein [Kofleriaceae bacterium]